MRILILTDNLVMGGVNRYCLTIAKGLKKRGIPFQIMAIGDTSNDFLVRACKAEGYSLYVVPFRVRLKTISQIAAKIKDFQPTVLHTQGYRSSIIGRIAARIWRIPTKVVTTIHGIMPNLTLRLYLYNSLDNWTTGLSDRLIAVSEDTGRQLTKKGVSSGRIRVIYNGVSEPEHQTNPGLQGPILGYVGRLTPDKGVVRLPAIFNAIKRRVPDCQLMIVGDGPLRSALEEMIEPANRKDVFFFGFQDEVAPFLDRMRAIIMPSITEGLPLVALEAMASGLPVVTTRVGGLPELIVDESTGFLTDPYDLDALVQRTCQLLESPSLAQSIGIRARQRYLEGFTTDHMVDQIVNVYDTLSRGEP